jgi:hypothetical protein
MRSLTIMPHTRLGPALFGLLGFLCAYLGLWLPLWRDRVYPPDFDTRIEWVISGFAPVTTGTAMLAAYGYIRLWLLQRKSPTGIGLALLIFLAFPVLASAVTGIFLAPFAIAMLPDFVMSLFWDIEKLLGL